MKELEISGDGIARAVGSITRQLPMLDAKRAGMELFGAPSFNAFNLFDPNENTLSRIAQNLFDPRGTHGQGSLFLNALLDAIGLEQVGPLDVVKVEREVLTDEKRRIDLVIETPTALVGIENKPWAKQQPDQLSDYLAALRKWRGEKKPILVFLSDFEPETAIGDVVEVSFADVGDCRPSLQSILEGIRPSIKANRVTDLVDQFIRFIDEHFGANQMSDAVEAQYIEAVTREFKKDEQRRAIAAIFAAQQQVHRQILTEIGDYICFRLGAAFEVMEHDSIDQCLAEKEEHWRVRRKDWPENLYLSIAAGSAEMSKVYFGVDAPDPRNKEFEVDGDSCLARPKIQKALKAVRGGKTTDWMPWWDWAEPRHWKIDFTAGLLIQTESGQVSDHPQIIRLADKFIELAECIDQALYEPD